MSTLSPEKLNANSNSMLIDDDFDMTFHDPPSSPFVSHIENDDQENIAPNVAPTPSKPLLDFSDDVPQSAFKVSPEKKFGVTQRASPMKNLMGDFEEAALKSNVDSQRSPRKSSPIKQIVAERPESAMSSHSHKRQSLSKSPRGPSDESTRKPSPFDDSTPETVPTPSKRPSSSHNESSLRDNEGLTVAMKYMEETRTESRETLTRQISQESDFGVDLGADNTDFNPDGPDLTSADMDDTCFSNFSEMPGLDMTKFAFLKQSPAKGGLQEVSIYGCK